MKEDIVIALDAAASELYEEETKQYYFPGEGVKAYLGRDGVILRKPGEQVPHCFH